MEKIKKFERIYEELGKDCRSNCTECAFNFPGYCGEVLIRSIMARLPGATEVSPCSPYGDRELIDFIRRNPDGSEEV